MPADDARLRSSRQNGSRKDRRFSPSAGGSIHQTTAVVVGGLNLDWAAKKGALLLSVRRQQVILEIFDVFFLCAVSGLWTNILTTMFRENNLELTFHSLVCNDDAKTKNLHWAEPNKTM